MKTHQLIDVIGRVRDRFHLLATRHLKEQGLCQLGPSHRDLLVHLFEQDSQTMASLAQGIGRDKSTVTILVKKLVAQGLVQSDKDAADARVARVKLTDKGRTLRPVFASIERDILSVAYQGFSYEERQDLMRLLGRLLQNL